MESRTKKRKINKKRIIIIIGIVLALVVGAGTVVAVKLLKKDPVPVVPVEQVRQYTTFQEKITEDYNTAQAQFSGAEEEMEIVLQTFGINFFTMWGVENSQDYNGQNFVSEAFKENFNRNVENNLFFRFPALVEIYGAANLPIATNVTHDELISEEIEIDGVMYGGFSTRMYMEYQNGTIAGTNFEDKQKADELLAKWVNSAKVGFYFVPNEDGVGGNWYIAMMKHMLSNENKDRDVNEYMYQGESVSTGSPDTNYWDENESYSSESTPDSSPEQTPTPTPTPNPPSPEEPEEPEEPENPDDSALSGE